MATYEPAGSGGSAVLLEATWRTIYARTSHDQQLAQLCAELTEVGNEAREQRSREQRSRADRAEKTR